MFKFTPIEELKPADLPPSFEEEALLFDDWVEDMFCILRDMLKLRCDNER